jgi:hypothetical protein
MDGMYRRYVLMNYNNITLLLLYILVLYELIYTIRDKDLYVIAFSGTIT